jgi:hypothetical protein
MKLIAALVIVAASAALAQTKPAPVVQQPLLYNVPFKSGQGYARYRIPALFVAAKRTLLAFCEGRHKAGQLTGVIDLVLRRSSDRRQDVAARPAPLGWPERLHEHDAPAAWRPGRRAHRVRHEDDPRPDRLREVRARVAEGRQGSGDRARPIEVNPAP